MTGSSGTPNAKKKTSEVLSGRRIADALAACKHL